MAEEALTLMAGLAAHSQGMQAPLGGGHKRKGGAHESGNSWRSSRVGKQPRQRTRVVLRPEG